jgi:hypothetical protein
MNQLFEVLIVALYESLLIELVKSDFNGNWLVLPEFGGIKNKKGTAPALGCTQV